MEFNYYGQIVVNNRTKATDRLYTYAIPKSQHDKAKIGAKVIVPFGKGDKLFEGYIFDIRNDSEIKKIKSIKYIFDDNLNLTSKQILLINWLRENYLCSYYDAIQTIVPTGTKLKKKKIYKINNKSYSNYNENDLSNKEIQLLDTISTTKDPTIQKLKKITQSDIDEELINLAKKGLIYFEELFYNEVNIKYKKIVSICHEIDYYNEDIFSKLERAPKQIEVLKYILSVRKIDMRKLLTQKSISPSVIKSLEKKGLIKIYTMEDYRSPINYELLNYNKIIKLNDEQVKAYSKIIESIDRKEFKRFLLHGITGSGKTEIYIRLVRDVINQKKQAIILVPEIALTTQLVNKFVERFGEKVAVLHSKLSLGERYDQWRKIKNNEMPIVIGARSAVFAPCNELGIIIMDEEHETSYKSEMHPKYHTSEVAEYRCKINKGVLVLGSATPSIESYYKANKNEYSLIQLKNRFNNNPLPTIDIVDMREELQLGNKSMFSKNLYDSMKFELSKNKQIILFLNRRGYSTFISCRKCGYVLECSNCDIALTYHQNNNIAKCHYCGYHTKTPVLCPECGSKYIKFFGIGTEKVEETVKKMFPNCKSERLDVDTTSKKGQIEKIITNFEKRKIDILIGTQMIAKGLDFPYVTLVGILSADTSLNLPDYRANERTFQLLTQVAGRAGRHNYNGRVVIQTYSPENYALIASQTHDYSSFYNTEINIRKEFFYPPFCQMINIIISGENEKTVIRSSHILYQQMKSKCFEERIKDVAILGPNPAIHSKIKKNYRWQLLIKYTGVDHENIKSIINNICDIRKNKIIDKNVSINFDLNPYNIF